MASAMTHPDDLGALQPSRWQPATAAGATVEVEATPAAQPVEAAPAI